MRYNAQRLKLMTPVAYYNENNEHYVRILELLSELTPRNLSIQDLKSDLESYKFLTRRVPKVDLDIPQVPETLTNDIFKRYVTELTQKFYLKRGASSQNVGIVGILLKKLFTPDNQATFSLRDTLCCNMVIHHFLKQNDLEYARFLLQNMPDMMLVPDTTTYNCFIRQLTVHRTLFTVNPLVTLCFLLAEMKQRKIPANVTTWALIFRMTKRDAIFQNVMLDTYRKLELPIPPMLSHIMLDSQAERLSSERLLLVYQGLSHKNIDLFHLVLRKLLQERKYDEAYQFVKGQHKFTPNSKTLQEFLQMFSSNREPHLALGAYITFTRKYKVVPSRSNFYDLMKSVTNTGYHRYWRPTARVVYHEMIRYKVENCNKCGYYITELKLRALRDVKHPKSLDLRAPLKDSEVKLLHDIETHLDFEKGIYQYPLKSQNKMYRKICQKVGAMQTKSSNNGLTVEQKEEAQRLKSRLLRLKQIIKFTNIQKHNSRRLKISNNGPVRFLVGEMKRRKIARGHSLRLLGLPERTPNPEPLSITT